MHLHAATHLTPSPANPPRAHAAADPPDTSPSSDTSKWLPTGHSTHCAEQRAPSGDTCSLGQGVHCRSGRKGRLTLVCHEKAQRYVGRHVQLTAGRALQRSRGMPPQDTWHIDSDRCPLEATCSSGQGMHDKWGVAPSPLIFPATIALSTSIPTFTSSTAPGASE